MRCFSFWGRCVLRTRGTKYGESIYAFIRVSGGLSVLTKKMSIYTNLTNLELSPNCIFSDYALVFFLREAVAPLMRIKVTLHEFRPSYLSTFLIYSYRIYQLWKYIDYSEPSIFFQR